MRKMIKNNPSNDIDDLYQYINLKDSHWLAKRLDVSYETARRMGRENKIPNIRIGKLIKYDPLIIDQWISENTNKEREY